MARVYPRTCGGTRIQPAQDHVEKGLSPHVRGNLNVGIPEGAVVGSIPARAGEPDTATIWGNKERVYPRTCGGTAANERKDILHKGLSPHVRGNRLRW